MARPKKGDYTAKEWENKFEIAWKVYPSREGQKSGKTAAKKAWNKLNKTEDNFNQIMKSLDDHRQLPDWKQGTKFVPLMSTWLNGERYKDEIVVPGGRPSAVNTRPPMSLRKTYIQQKNIVI